MPSFILGKRSADMARRFMLDLAGRLVSPANPHASDAHAYARPGYRPIVQLSTDGFSAYPAAVDLASGPYVKFGTIVKDYRNAQIIYTPSEIVGTRRRAVYGVQEGEERSICTSHIERHNLTTRTFMKRFNRLTLGFSKKLENLAAATAMYIEFYNYCWRPRKPGNTGKRYPTPCMMAGLTIKPWSFAELFERVVAYVRAIRKKPPESGFFYAPAKRFQLRTLPGSGACGHFPRRRVEWRAWRRTPTKPRATTIQNDRPARAGRTRAISPSASRPRCS